MLGAGSVWVANALDGTVSRIDAADRIRSSQIDVRGEPTALAFGAGALWVANGESRTVAQVDPGSNRVVGELAGRQRVPRRRRGLRRALGDVGDRRPGAPDRPRESGAAPVDRRSARTRARSRPAPARSGWRARSPARHPPRPAHRGGRRGRDPRRQGAERGRGGAGAMWAANRPDGTVSRIDPRTNAVSWTVPVGAEPGRDRRRRRRRVGRGRQRRQGPRIDPERRGASSRPTSGAAPPRSRSSDGAAWASAVAPPASHRGGTLRVIRWLSPQDPVPIDWLAGGLRPRDGQLISLAYDGLVGVPADRAARPGRRSWARWPRTRRNPSTTGGRTSSRSAPGCSSRTARPCDRRTSAPRSSASFSHARQVLHGVLRGIVGADRCIRARRAATCRPASRRMRGHERSRSISTHPDEEFLHKLTFSFAYVVPAEHPAARGSGTTCRPAPGRTGSTTWDARARRHAGPQSPLPVVVPGGPAGRVRRPHRGRGAQAGRARRAELGTAWSRSGAAPRT